MTESQQRSSGEVRIEDLKSKIEELEQRLLAVTAERDAARRQLKERAPIGVDGSTSGSDDSEDEDSTSSTCSFCNGEGSYWVHDFEMDCKRCDGTGRVKGS